MIYKNLSIAAGGGIIDHCQQVEQEDCANIIIGLGGTGIDCLKEVKKQVYNRIKPDDITSDIPTYQHIQFLAIDSDRCSINDETFASIDYTTEFIDISCNEIFSLIENLDLRSKNPSLRWLSDRITIWSDEAGAGGVRQIGRLLMMLKVSTVASKIQDSISKAINGLNFVPINIHILTGMGGGIGSGIFLDICYIIQHIINQLGLAGRANTYGYFFLPDVNMERVHADAVRQYITINGFAAMKELDHCMNFQQNGCEWNQTYDCFTVNTKKSPVNVAFLVSARDENGAIRKNGYNNALNVVADYILNTMIRQGLPVWMPFVPDQQQSRGACYRYCILGASHAYIPFIDINSYLAARIFEAYQKLPVTNHDIETFVYDNGLTYRYLLSELNKNVIIMSQDALMGLAPAVMPSLLSKIDEALSCVEEVIKSNRIELEHSVIRQIKNRLIEIATYQGKGPVYASLFLSNLNRNSVDLSDIIEGYINENNINLAQTNVNMKLRIRTMESTLGELQNARLQKNRKTRAYVSAVHSYCLEKSKIVLYKEMGDFLSQLKNQILDLYEKFFAPVNLMLSNVAETFNNNYLVLTNSTVYDSGYAEKLVDLNDTAFRKSLDVELESIDTEKVVSKFITYMISKTDEWLDHTSDSKICKAVSEFFIQQLNGVAYQDIDYYLREKYQVVNQQQLSIQIYQDVLIRLKERARPLFWTNTSIETFDNNRRTGFCLFPSNSATINAAAIMLNQADNQISISSTAEQDRISLFIFNRNIPMFMYRGSAVNKAFYEQHMTPGLHIYEGTDQDHRDFRKLPSIIPLSLSFDDDLEDVKDFICEYKIAVENGIIIKQGYDYQLRLVDDEDFLEKKQRIESFIKKYHNASGEELVKWFEEVNDFLKDENNTHVRFMENIILPNNGVLEYEDSVVRDHVFSSEFYTFTLYEQLKKVDEINTLRLDLQSLNTFIAE